MNVLEFDSVFKKTPAYVIRNFSLNILPGEIHAIVCQEPEAQKMIIDMVGGVLEPDVGTLIYRERVIKKGDFKHLSRIGIVTKSIFFYENLTGYENLKLTLKSYRKYRTHKSYKAQLKKIDDYFDLLNIGGYKDTLVKKYANGTKQKLRLIRGLMMSPDCLILDDPFQYLDSVTIQIVMEHLREKCQQDQLSVMVLSSSFDPIGRLSNKVSLMYHGNIVDTISRAGLLSIQKSHLNIVSDDLSKFLMYLEKDLSIFDYEVMDDETVYVYEALDKSHKIVRMARSRSIGLQKVQFGYDPLENYFLNQLGDSI